MRNAGKAVRGEIDESMRRKLAEVIANIGESGHGNASSQWGLFCPANALQHQAAVPTPDTQATYLAWLQVREQLEGIGAREAALRVTPRDIAQLRMIFRPYLRKGAIAQHELADYAEADARFHQQIIHLSGNALLQRLWALFGHQQMQIVKAITLESLDRAQVSMRDHLAIIDAFESADAERAAFFCRKHIRTQYDHICHGLQ
jgi:DNA-binding FadR family transcriptional regulator